MLQSSDTESSPGVLSCIKSYIAGMWINFTLKFSSSPPILNDRKP
jgi:hypothetical protein